LVALLINLTFVAIFKLKNDHYHSINLVAANSSFQRIGSFGQIGGSVFGGLALDYFGKNGLPAIVICIILLFFVVSFFAKTQLISKTS